MSLRPRIRHRLDPRTYQQQTFANLGGSIISKREVSAIRDKLDSSDRTILEVGIGPGRITQDLSERGSHIVGIDLDDRMVRHVRNKTKTRKNVDLAVADGQVLPFREGAFDAVICIRVMKYFRSPAKGLSEMGATLRPGGKLILEYPNLLGFTGIFQSLQRIVFRETFPLLFKRASVERHLRQIGIRVVTANPLFKIPPVIWTHTHGNIGVRILTILDSMIQRITPPELLSNSMIMLTEKAREIRLLKKDEILV
jgi:SAM-dependent methyltransferase